MWDVANCINFFHADCHRPAAALGFADPDVVQHAGRRSRSKSGTEGLGRSAEAHRAGAAVQDNRERRIRLIRLNRPGLLAFCASSIATIVRGASYSIFTSWEEGKLSFSASC